MFELRADKNNLTVLTREMLTSGSVNVYRVRFEFSSDWDGLNRVAVFRAGNTSTSMALSAEDWETDIPWEALQSPGVRLYGGVYGTRGETVVLPTIWADLGYIQTGVSLGDESRPPTPDLWEQELSKKGDSLKYDGLNLSLMSGDKKLSTVEIAGGEGGIVYRFGHGLKQDGLNVSVDAVSDFTGDNTLPMTAAGVQASVGNIEALLATI